jgi:Fe-S-cluster containining protein
MLQELAVQLMLLYEELDRKTHAFAAAAGLQCPQGCGECCRSEKVETTVLEMLPLAFHLFHTKQAELLIKRLEKPTDSKQCIFFRGDFCQQGDWGCSQYQHRGLVCRLFGYAGLRDRNGTIQFTPCKVMQQSCSPKCRQWSSESMPLFSEAGMQITSMHPALGTRRLPINQAVLIALYKVGFFQEMTGAEAIPTAVDEPLPPPITPLFPNPPITKKAV